MANSAHHGHYLGSRVNIPFIKGFVTTDLNAAAWTWVAPYLPAHGRALPIFVPSSMQSFTCCAPGVRGACCPANSRARAPFTITFGPGRRRASWLTPNGPFMRRRACSPASAPPSRGSGR